MSQGNILIVEDEPVIRSSLRRLLVRNGYDVTEAESAEDACRHSLESFDLIISDLRLPGEAGTVLIERSKYTPVLIMTSYASLRSAVDSMKMGAVDYIAKPFDHENMLNSVAEIIGRAHDRENEQQDSAQTQKQPAISESDSSRNTAGIIGHCPPMQTLFNRIDRVAPTEATVLILGESGTGKELVAKALHNASRRKASPMISVNCAAIPETLIESELFGHERGAFTGATTTRNGLIEAADGGTLFLDEIGELPLEAQARLLRVLQEGEIRRVGSVESRKVNVRLIAATHRNLKLMASEGDFREDLYYRLNVVELRLPPLRERGQDITLLAEALLEKTVERMGTGAMLLSPEALVAISRHLWPGNVRELENAMERAVILCEDDMITPELLGLDEAIIKPKAKLTAIPEQSSDINEDDLSLEDYFQRFVLEHQEHMNETQLAKKLGISRKCLWERRKRLGIPRKETVA
ncbi:sigma-54 dependent transcriptional regulator [Sansalvadorimonas sp. 2012CJ34-2]|uniref:Sigma-54 dependent transcriptional regulator n=1 Tax=Parendozoicomonas callyspongiae TaxID=2942213 RepID=A0ABT0PKJ7_9GAMM|nr:sigma-54 dependent transcriptional regulator [Sansalvadorimonas sp. 2012CJ34-2]MCL6271771.1 sigma-54 dependent transcriptional regulator [Sansalvadorimonas sp. 2012CJ34-2]